MKRFNNLYAQICDMQNLKKAHLNARRGKAFYKEVKMVDDEPELYLGKIREMLLNHRYKVSTYTTKLINDKGKVRVLHKLPYYPDRIIHHAIMQVVEYIFERSFCYHTCASLKGRGIKRARILSKRYASLSGDKGAFCLKIDIEKFYSNINHNILKAQLARKIKDKELLALFDEIICNYTEKTGLPIGSYLSQYFANFYLNDFDHWLKEQKRQKYAVRFMDDVVIFGADKNALHTLLRQMRVYLWHNLRLKIKANWQIFPVKKRGVDFVGFRFFKSFVLLRKRTLKQCKKTLNKILKKQNKNELISYHLFSSINSYIGFLRQCNGWRFTQKMIMPIVPSLARYYFLRLCNENLAFKKRKATLHYTFKVFNKHCANNADFLPKEALCI